jgi:hypothetical protein
VLVDDTPLAFFRQPNHGIPVLQVGPGAKLGLMCMLGVQGKGMHGCSALSGDAHSAQSAI